MYYDKLKLRFCGVFCFFGVLGGGRMKQVLNRILFFILVSTFVCLETSTQSVATDFSDFELVSYQVDENYPPLTYTKNMRLYGFDPDFTNLIFNRAEYGVTMSSGNWTDIYDSLVKGNIDIAGIIAITDKRKKEVLFTNPLFESSVSVYTRENYEKIQLEDLKDLKVGVGKGYYTEALLKDELGIMDAVTYIDLKVAIQDLLEGNIDAIFEDQWLMDNLLREDKNHGVIIPQLTKLYPLPHAYAVSKDRPELVFYMNYRIDELKKQGIFEELYLKYFYQHSDYYYEKIKVQIFYTVIAILSVLVLALVTLKQYIQLLKRKIASNYKQIEESNDTLQSQNEEIQAQYDEIQSQYQEIEEHKEEIEKSEERYRMVFDITNDGIWDFDLTSDSFTLTLEWADRLGFPSSVIENFSVHWMELIHLKDQSILLEQLLERFQTVRDSWIKDIEFLDRNKNSFWVHVRAKLIRNYEGKIIRLVGSFSDISQHKEYEEKIYNLAYFDYLTNIPNRVKLKEKLEEMLQEMKQKASMAALFYVDLDNFKHINDTLGHGYGDLLLKEIAKVFQQLMKPGCSVFRVGGDEFIVLCENMKNHQQIRELADCLLEELRKEWRINEVETFVSVSVGITVIPEDGVDYHDILKNADAAMYVAKEEGKGRYKFFHEDMLRKVKARSEMENSIRKAIEKNEFHIFYQPYYDIKKEKIIGMEALLRWKYKKKEMIPPSIFIPIAEETGQIREIGSWVLKEACKQNKKWQEMGYKKIPVSVNVSEIQMEDVDFPDLIIEALHESELLPKYLHIEVTESCVIKSLEKAIELQRIIRNMGIEIYLDDFGTGYSSLNNLQLLPISTVKIDKSFIDQILRRDENSLILEEIISIAHKLKMNVIAEGVEEEQQKEYLKSKSCDYIQGYYYSKPLPKEEMEKLLQLEERVNLT